MTLRGATLLAVLALTAAAAPARAAETQAPPSHLTAYNLDWLNYIDPADIPPGPPKAVCLVDTGVAVTPDTPPDDPVNGPIVARLAGDGGSGLPFDNSPAQLHGTRMAFAATAPQNDWGTIGTWTGGRIISVRATRNGEPTFAPDAYSGSIQRCIKAAETFPIAAINFSLGCSQCALTEDQIADLRNRIEKAHTYNMSVVAAAGNSGGSALELPAGLEGVVAVAAGDPRGALCEYSAYDERVAAVAAGCPVESADVLTGVPVTTLDGGTSAAAVAVSSYLALLRTLRPDSTYAQAERWVLDGVRVLNGRPVLDGRAAAVAAGLGTVLERADARREAAIGTPSPEPTPTIGREDTDSEATESPQGITLKHWRLPTPTLIHARRANDRADIRVRRPLVGSVLEVCTFGRPPEVTRQYRKRCRRTRVPRVFLRVPAPQSVRLRLLRASSLDGRSPSPPLWLWRGGRRYR